MFSSPRSEKHNQNLKDEDSGLGNPHRNGLFACQLLRIQSRVNALYPAVPLGDAVPFWMDTLCVPLDELTRKKAIISMKRVYKEASKILVLEATIQQGNVSECTSLELMFRIATSTWLTRLWTYQEAALNRHLHYQFDDKALTRVEIQKRFREVLPPEERIGEISSFLWFNATVLVDPVEAFNVIPNMETYVRFRFMANSLAYRTTSKAKDEAICLAGCLGRDVSDLVILSSAADRLRCLIESLDYLPDSILFSNQPRYQEYGRRWIPKTFLGGGASSLLPARPGKAYPSKDGLLVESQGLLFITDDPIITLSTQSGQSEHPLNVGLFISAGTHNYYVYSKDTTIDVNSLILNSEIKRFGILLKDPIQFSNRYLGLLVDILTQGDSGEVTFCRYNHCVYVARDDQSEWPLVGNISNLPNLKGNLVGPVRWCVG